jgi:hypothetical protein
MGRFRPLVEVGGSGYRLWFWWERLDDLWCGADPLGFGVAFSPGDLSRLGVEGAFNVGCADTTSHASREGEVDEVRCFESDFFRGCSLAQLFGLFHNLGSEESRVVEKPRGV